MKIRAIKGIVRASKKKIDFIIYSFDNAFLKKTSG